MKRWSGGKGGGSKPPALRGTGKVAAEIGTVEGHFEVISRTEEGFRGRTRATPLAFCGDLCYTVCGSHKGRLHVRREEDTGLRIRMAGLTIELTPRYSDTAVLCQRYLASPEATPDFSVSVTEEEIRREGEADGCLALGYLETLALYRKISERVLETGRFLFHGSVLSFDGQGVLFTAPSGTGKSTHAALWRRLWGDRVTMVNDDKPLLTVGETCVFASGTPWDGKHRLSENITVPLRAIVLLSRGETNEIAPIGSGVVYPRLLGQTYRPAEPTLLARTLELLDRALARTSLYALRCTPEPEAAVVAHRAIFSTP